MTAALEGGYGALSSSSAAWLASKQDASPSSSSSSSCAACVRRWMMKFPAPARELGRTAGDMRVTLRRREVRQTRPSSVHRDHHQKHVSRPAQVDKIWEDIKMEALDQSQSEPCLASFLYASVIAHPTLERSLAFHLANKLADTTLLSTQLFSLFSETYAEDLFIQEAIRADIQAFRQRDPACTSYVHGMLNFKGFLACQAYRVAHRLWGQGRNALALALQNRMSEVFQVDIHPAAKIGKGILFDHATGVVVGETATIGNDVSILHHVTLGGTGNSCADRHPKIGNGVLIGAAATLLGPVKVGDGAKIGACSLVLIDVPQHCTAVGVPARIIKPSGPVASPQQRDLPGQSMDHTSEIIDYVI